MTVEASAGQPDPGFWRTRPVLVTGGASFIGSHLTDLLVALGARVRVADDLSSGSLGNLRRHLDAGSIDFIECDLRDATATSRAVEGVSVIFHLAAKHGGRGYVELHQADCASNLVLDGVVFAAGAEMGVDNIVFASSGCVYPNHLQRHPEEELYLTEEMVGPPYDADNMYGWAKLMGELTLRALHRDRGQPSVSCRLFTVYGERGREGHALIAMIARAFVGQSPFVVWGDGEQVRNWTYVGDTVRGLVLSAERIRDASAVNLGTTERIRVREAVQEVMVYSGHQAPIEYRCDMPSGPLNRVADARRALRLLRWRTEVPFVEGLHRTIDWYFGTKDRRRVRASLESLLTES